MSYSESNRVRIYPNSGEVYYLEEEPQPAFLITQKRRSSSTNIMPRQQSVINATDPQDRLEKQQQIQDKNSDDNDNENVPRSIRLQQIIIDLIIIILTFLIFVFVYFFVSPKLAYFTCDQSDIFYPYKPDTVPFWAVGLYGVAGTLLIILLVEFARSSTFFYPKTRTNVRTALIFIYNIISLFVLGIAITLTLTEIGKRWAGRLRPHFITVCQPNQVQFNCSVASAVTGFTYTPIYTGDASFCQNTDSSEIKEARLSFPSGHASFSTYCMLFLIVYAQARWISFRLRYFKVLLQTAAFIAAYVTSISRVSDYHHRGSDVLGGVALGAIIALFLTIFIGAHTIWSQRDVDDKKK